MRLGRLSVTLLMGMTWALHPKSGLKLHRHDREMIGSGYTGRTGLDERSPEISVSFLRLRGGAIDEETWERLNRPNMRRAKKETEGCLWFNE